MTVIKSYSTPSYSVAEGSAKALDALCATLAQTQLPRRFLDHKGDVVFTSTSGVGDSVCFPCPMKEQEAIAAIKALEALAAAAIDDKRNGEKRRREIKVDLEKAACFLMSAYLVTIDGKKKGDKEVKTRIRDTDLNHAQSIPYRRLSANLYETKDPGQYYHIHGSLDATKTLKMIGLQPHEPNLKDYHQCIEVIEAAVRKHTVPQLEKLNAQHGQAGVPALKADDFLNTQHGKVLQKLPPFTVRNMESTTPPVPFSSSSSSSSSSSRPQALAGIRVLELCRVIAGPVIGRSLAAHGADVLKVTSARLPDVPFFQVDVNTGKHTTELDLRGSKQDAETFEKLLAEADVLIDGYRPGALARLGYGPEKLLAIAQKRNRGFVYVAEDCFGGSEGVDGTRGEWAHRPGWQQIADCVTGVAWDQGTFMGLDEPVVPPFPMSDYGTGALGCVAAMMGLYQRATVGGSWVCRTSLCQYDLFLQSLGAHDDAVQAQLRREHDKEFFELHHNDSVDEVGRRALASVSRLTPHLFQEDMLHRAFSPGFGYEVTWPREAIEVEGLHIGHVRASRPNGADTPSWEDWEVDEKLVAASS